MVSRTIDPDASDAFHVADVADDEVSDDVDDALG